MTQTVHEDVVDWLLEFPSEEDLQAANGRNALDEEVLAAFPSELDTRPGPSVVSNNVTPLAASIGVCVRSGAEQLHAFGSLTRSSAKRVEAQASQLWSRAEPVDKLRAGTRLSATAVKTLAFALGSAVVSVGTALVSLLRSGVGCVGLLARFARSGLMAVLAGITALALFVRSGLMAGLRGAAACESFLRSGLMAGVAAGIALISYIGSGLMAGVAGVIAIVLHVASGLVAVLLWIVALPVRLAFGLVRVVTFTALLPFKARRLELPATAIGLAAFFVVVSVGTLGPRPPVATTPKPQGVAPQQPAGLDATPPDLFTGIIPTEPIPTSTVSQTDESLATAGTSFAAEKSVGAAAPADNTPTIAAIWEASTINKDELIPLPAPVAETLPTPPPLGGMVGTFERTPRVAENMNPLDLVRPETSDVGPPPAAAPRPEPAAPSSPSAVPAASTNDASIIRSVLGRYQQAFSTLDVPAARALWPTVDAKALERAFSQLEQQVVEFQTCQIAVLANRAIADCGGHTRYVRRIGSKSPREETRQWKFNLHKLDDRWLIDAVDTH